MKIFFAYILDTTKDFFKKFKKTVLILLSISVIGGGIVGVDMLGGETTQEKIDALPVEQLLKVTPDKIIKSEDLIVPVCIKQNKADSFLCDEETTSSITKYSYLSDKEVSAEEYKGYDEVISKREKNAQYFESGTQGVAKVYFDERFGGTENKYLMETATTTKEAFDLQDKVSFFRSFFKAANADTATTGPTLDTYLDMSTPTTVKYSTETPVIHGYGASNKATAQFKITIPAGSGTISDVKLVFYYTNSATVSSADIDAHVIRRTDMVFTEATWNVYKTGSNWTAGGCLDTTNDYNSTIVDHIAPPFSGPTWYSWGLMGATADNPLSLTWGDVTYIMLKPHTFPSDSKYYIFASSKYTVDTTKRPYIEITYTAGGGAAPVKNNDITIFE